MKSIPWSNATSPGTDQSVRMFITEQGGGRKGDLSRFVETAVHWARENGSKHHAQRKFVDSNKLAGLSHQGSVGRTRIVEASTFCSEVL